MNRGRFMAILIISIGGFCVIFSIIGILHQSGHLTVEEGIDINNPNAPHYVCYNQNCKAGTYCSTHIYKELCLEKGGDWALETSERDLWERTVRTWGFKE
jgi:hypothetical protein